MTQYFDDPELGAADGWVPIREVARITGVNPVTLRAWERRYGLIVPRRTAKGHRLYDDSHVQRIQSIVSWLNRGVAVSQVKQLLDARQSINLAEHNQWGGLHDEMMRAVGGLNERQLDDAFNRALALYPPRTLCRHLLLPLLLSLEQRWHSPFGADLERAVFQSWLRTKLGTRLYHANRQHHGAPLLLLNLCEQRFEPGLWLCAWLVSSAGCPVDLLEWPVPLNELPWQSNASRHGASCCMPASHSTAATSSDNCHACASRPASPWCWLGQPPAFTRPNFVTSRG